MCEQQTLLLKNNSCLLTVLTTEAAQVHNVAISHSLMWGPRISFSCSTVHLHCIRGSDEADELELLIPCGTKTSRSGGMHGRKDKVNTDRWCTDEMGRYLSYSPARNTERVVMHG
jgi:hypothetical protein